MRGKIGGGEKEGNGTNGERNWKQDRHKWSKGQATVLSPSWGQPSSFCINIGSTPHTHKLPHP